VILHLLHYYIIYKHIILMYLNFCPGFGWDGVNFPPRSCCVLDLVQEETLIHNTDVVTCCYDIKDFFQFLLVS